MAAKKFWLSPKKLGALAGIIRAGQERGKNDLQRTKILTEASKVAVSLTGFRVGVSIGFRLRKTEWTPPQLL